MSFVIKFLCYLVLTLWAAASEHTLVTYERPVPEGGGPTVVYCTVGVIDVDEISDADQNFTANIYLFCRWSDPSLAHEGPGMAKVPLFELWHPSIIVFNRQLVRSSMGNFAEVTPEGEVRFRQQLWGNFSQPTNLHDFPLDTQSYGIQLVATGYRPGVDLILAEDPNVKSFVTENYSVADWKILGSSVDTSPLVIPNVTTASSFRFSFTAKRLSFHYLIKIVAPLLLIVTLSQVVFWLNPSEGGSQLGVAVTSFLTVIAYHVALSSQLPEIAYLTKLDVFVFWATMLVFLAMIEVVITTGLAQKGNEEKARKLDKVCRVVFPTLTALGGYYAFFWH